MIAMLLVSLAGALSAWVYARARRWPDCALVLAAAAALACLLADFKRPAPPMRDVPIDPDAALIDLRSAATITASGNGLSAARWRDLPARPLRWQAPQGGVLQLDFPRSVPPGAPFTLAARFDGRSGLRLQLLGENGQLLADARDRVQWTPTAAGDLVLRARVLDGQGRLLAQGPVPLRVEAGAPLRVQGRFAAPSFDRRALRMLFESSPVLLDWQVTLAPGVVRTVGAPLERADLIVADAQWLERQHAAVRRALLAQVEGGARLLVLGAGASDRAFWSDWLGLELGGQHDLAKERLALTQAAWQPAAQGGWSRAGSLATRAWGAGRIGWLGAADWHRHAITAPAALGQWWQGVIDRLGVTRAEPLVWLEAEPMPLAGQRLEVCAYGANGEVEFPQLRQTLAWQRRPERADAACVAVWPRQKGWLQVRSKGQSTRIYVYAASDWPAWQGALNRAATRRYAQRTPQPAQGREERLPAWPFAAVFALSMLGLWWRERSSPAAPLSADPASSSSGR